MSDAKTRVSETMRLHKPATRKVLLTAGTGYGLLFGLGFALFVWGYDAWVLTSISADLAWAKFAFGFPLALLIGGLAGFLGMLPSWTGVTIAIWAIASGVLGWIAGHIPYEGNDLIVGFLEPRFAGQQILPYMQIHQARTIMAILFNGLFGIVAGYVELTAVDWAWDRTTPQGRLSLGSWIMLMVAMLVALLPAATVSELIMRPIRNPQVYVAQLVDVMLSEGVAGVEAKNLNLIEAERYGDKFTPGHTIYFSGFLGEADALYSAYADIAFDNDFMMRCIVMGSRVTFCDDLETKLNTAIGDLAYAGMTGERRWMQKQMKPFTVDEDVMTWLQAFGRQHGEQLDSAYTLERITQKNSWILITAHFESGFDMVCRFHGAAVVNVDQCDVLE